MFSTKGLSRQKSFGFLLSLWCVGSVAKARHAVIASIARQRKRGNSLSFWAAGEESTKIHLWILRYAQYDNKRLSPYFVDCHENPNGFSRNDKLAGVTCLAMTRQGTAGLVILSHRRSIHKFMDISLRSIWQSVAPTTKKPKTLIG